jgi:predicted transposase/invertase (TIGR01784 family)
VDILVENEEKELIIIELQFTSEYDYFQRMLFGASKVITQFMAKGNDYGKVRKVYSINIVYFDLGEGNDYVYHGNTTFYGLHTGDKLRLTPLQHQEFGVLDVSDLFPEYYILEVTRFDDTAKDSLDEWIYYLKHNAIEDGFKAQGLPQARELLNYDRLPEGEKRAYDRAVDRKRDEHTWIYTAKAEGEAIGVEKGIAQGKAEGKTETLTGIIHNAWRKGHSAKDIAELTSLPEEEIRQIIRNSEF